MVSNNNQLYRKSDYLVKITGDNGKSVVYHSLFNNPQILDESLISLIDKFFSPKLLLEVIGEYEGDILPILDEFIDRHFIVKQDEDERQLIAKHHQPFVDNIQTGSRLSRLELAISDACNLGCSHCMHFTNNQISARTSPSLNMTIEIARKSIDSFVSKVRELGNKHIRVHFGNGEPLLNWRTMKYCLEYCSSITDLTFSFAVNTNLTILTREMAETLKQYNVKISTSLDGLKEGNDLIRINRKGQGTFEKIISRIQLLKEIEHPIEGFTVTITARNFALINTDLIDFAKNIGVKDITMDCDLVNTTEIPLEELVNKIITLRAYANKKSLNFYGTWETPYRAILTESWLHNPHAFCPAMEGKTLSFGVDGSLKTCGHTNTKIGDLNKLNQIFYYGSTFTRLIKDRLPGNNIMCNGCLIEGSCAGQCQVTVESSKRNDKLLETMCDFMRLMTLALLKEHLRC